MQEIKEVIINEPYGFIYITTNLINGKKYLGQKSFGNNNEWKTYLGSGTAFQRALEKYGKENFSRNIVCFCYSENELNKAENDLSVFFNVVEDPEWYNLVYGGGSTRGYTHSDEVKQAQSARARECWQNEEYRQKHIDYGKTLIGEKNPNFGNHKLAGENNPMWGKQHTEETKQKMSEIHSNPSEETRQKLREAAIARCTDEWKEHLREINTGKQHTEETKQKMSEAHKERWTDELRETWSIKTRGENNGMYGKHHSEETKQLLSEMFSGEKSCKYGTHPSEETLEKMRLNSPFKKAVVQLDVNGSYISEYYSMSEAERVTGISENNICTALKTSHFAGGYLWFSKEEYNPNQIVTYVNHTFVAVVQIDTNGNYVSQYINAHEAERQTGILSQNIGQCCKEKHRTAGGFFWRKLDEYDPDEIFEYKSRTRAVVQLDLDGNFIAEYSSIKNAAEATGFPKSSIRKCCATPNKILHGYRWMYLEDYKQSTEQNEFTKKEGNI